MLILGIESSCDETAAAVVKNGDTILSSIIASQVDVHSQYGGVVPELASRMHIEAVSPVVEQAFEKAGITADDIEGVAATQGPGLLGALLVGFCFARSFAWARNLPLAGVNHLEAHIFSLFLTPDPPKFPFVALVVSGGHTNIYHVTSFDHLECMGQTRDDAAGEAFDKVAKMLGLGYPGGPVIESMARTGQPIKTAFPRIFLEKDSLDFSFSGLKSAVMRHLETYPVQGEQDKKNIAAAFQNAVFDVLSHKLIQAAKKAGCSTIALTGGVAASRSLAGRLISDVKQHGLSIKVPPAELCTDNGAMIAARGFYMIQNKQTCDLDSDVFSRLLNV